MKAFMFKKIAFAAALALAATSASATDTRFYAGPDAGVSTLDGSSKDYASVGGFFGFRFNHAVAIEAGLRRLGQNDGATADQAAVSAVFTGYAKGEWTRISLFGRVGVNHVNFDSCNFACGEDRNSLLLGVGVGYDFTPRITGRLEYQRPTSDSSNVSIGVAFGF